MTARIDEHGADLDQLGRRCAELARTTRGYEMCHCDEHPADEPHHVRDRAWFTDGRPTPRLRLGQPCGEACKWPDHVVPYLGTRPGSTTVAAGVNKYAPRSPARPPSDLPDTGGPHRARRG